LALHLPDKYKKISPRLTICTVSHTDLFISMKVHATKKGARKRVHAELCAF